MNYRSPFTSAWIPATYHSCDFINANASHRDINPYVISPSQPLTGNLGVAIFRDQHIPTLSLDFQQQIVDTAYGGSNNGWNLSGFTTPPPWKPDYQESVQSLIPVTQGFGQPYNSAPSLVNYPPGNANIITNDQLSPFLQFPEFGLCDNFGDVPDAIADGQPGTALQLPDPALHNNYDIVPNGDSNFHPFFLLDNSTALDPQLTITSLDQLSFSTTTSMPAVPASLTHVSNITATHAVHPAALHPVVNGVATRRPNRNTTPYICDYPGCGISITRQGDFLRHKQKHDVPGFPCLVHGCGRRGRRAFYRADKLRDHQRKKHRMAI